MSYHAVSRVKEVTAKPFIFDVPDSVPASQLVKVGVRKLPLHKHVMTVEGKSGEFRVSLEELHSTPDARQKNRRAIYHILRGSGSVVLDGKEHSLAKGNLVIIAPNAKFSFKAKSGKFLTVLHISVPNIFPVTADASAVASIESGAAEMSVCGFKKFLHVLRNEEGEGAHVALLDITGAPKHMHKKTLEYYYFHNGGIMNLNGVDHRVKKGTMVILPPGVIHAARGSKPGANTLAYMGYFPPLLYRGHALRDEYLVESDQGRQEGAGESDTLSRQTTLKK